MVKGRLPCDSFGVEKGNEMRIGYCTTRDPFNKKSMSGLDYHMMKSLEKCVCKLIPLGPLLAPYSLPGKVLERLINRLLGKKFYYTNLPFIAKSIADDLESKIEKVKPDLLFFPNACELLSYLDDTHIPTVYFSDATFRSMVGYYEYFSSMLRISEKWYDECEAKSIEKADIILYSSHWAAESAVKDYGCPIDKIHVIPCGGNIDPSLIPSRKQIFQLEREKRDRLKLLYIGSSWKRKGGDIALKTILELNRRGIEATLTVCGTGPSSLKDNDKVDFVGFLDQNNPEELLRFQKLYLDASMFVLPTRSECFGFVFAEAASCGLPIVSTATGGVPDYVDHGVNGYLLPLEAGYMEYADKIEHIWRNKSRYREFSDKSRIKYEKELNWDTWGRKVRQVLNRLFTS